MVTSVRAKRNGTERKGKDIYPVGEQGISDQNGEIGWKEKRKKGKACKL